MSDDLRGDLHGELAAAELESVGDDLDAAFREEPAEHEPAEDLAPEGEDLADTLRKAWEEAEDEAARPSAGDLDDLFADLSPDVDRRGYVANLREFERRFNADPATVIEKMVQGVAMSLDGAGRIELARRALQAAGLAEVDPRHIGEAALDQRVTRAVSARMEQAQRQAAVASAQRELAEFAASAPRFNEVRATMGGLMASGAAKSLQDAYRRAVASHDADKLLGQQRQTAAAGQRAQIQRARAAHTPRTASVPARPVKDAEVDEPLSATLRKVYQEQVGGRRL